MIDFNYPAYGCNNCGGAFQVIENGVFNAEKTKEQQVTHIEKCTPEQPFTDDPNIVGFI